MFAVHVKGARRRCADGERERRGETRMRCLRCTRRVRRRCGGADGVLRGAVTVARAWRLLYTPPLCYMYLVIQL